MNDRKAGRKPEGKETKKRNYLFMEEQIIRVVKSQFPPEYSLSQCVNRIVIEWLFDKKIKLK